MKIETSYYNMTPFMNLLQIETFAAWDERVFKEYLSDIKTIALKFYRNKPWAILVDRRLWELHTPGTEKMFTKIASGKRQTSLKHVAVVVGDSELKKWQIGNITKDAPTTQIKFFNDINKAISWLSSEGYEMNPLG